MRQEIEIMRVLRVPPLGKLVVEVSGQRFQSLAEVNHAKVEQRLLAAIGELIAFAGGYQVLVNASVAPPLQLVTPAEEQVTKEERLKKEQERFLAQMEAQAETLRRELPPIRPGDEASPLLAAAYAKRAARAVTMAEQIDAILQKHLAKDAEMAGRTIRVCENPAGGLLIEVDGHFYDRPREIPEVAIQRLIKKTLKEWEAD